MPSDQIQWFPGHMAKTRRMIGENLSLVDFVIELRDARIPESSKNPEIAKLVQNKPVLTIFTKSSLADPDKSVIWQNYFRKNGQFCLFCDNITGAGIGNITAAAEEMMAEKLERYQNKGMTGRGLKAMVVGIPNVGKSSLINKLSDGKRAKVEDRPGVTVNKQWVKTSVGIDLLDMPGILWPKFSDRRVGENLAITGAIKDDIMDTEGLAMALCGRLRKLYPELMSARYKLGDMSAYEELDDYDLFLTVGRKRGFLVSGGEINTERTAAVLLDEFRGGKIGRITLELPGDGEISDTVEA